MRRILTGLGALALLYLFTGCASLGSAEHRKRADDAYWRRRQERTHGCQHTQLPQRYEGRMVI